MLVQRVAMPGGDAESWTVVDHRFDVVAPVDRFLAYLSSIERSPNTVRSYAFDLRDFFWFLQGQQVGWTAVSQADVGRFVSWLRLPPAARRGDVTLLPGAVAYCSATTINRKLSAVVAFYEFHARHGVDCVQLLVTVKPGRSSGTAWRPFLAHLGTGQQRRKTIKLTGQRRLPRELTAEQVSAVLAGCYRRRDRLLLGLLAGTGMRIGEVLGLRHEDIDAPGRLVRVRKRRNANGARVKSGQREIPIPAELVRLYADYLVFEYGDLDCDYVFVNLWGGDRGAAWRYWNVTDLVERLRERSGVRFTAHMLRHTYATDLLRRGVPAEVVQKLLGHASITTTIGTYAHLGIDDVRRALEQVGWLPELTAPLAEPDGRDLEGTSR